MVSVLVKERFAALLRSLGEAERKAEVTRQVLVERPEFDAYSCYRRMTQELYNGITLPEMKDFFADHDLYPVPYDLDLLFVHCDYDQDAVIGWDEFLMLMLTKENEKGTPYGYQGAFSLECEHSLMRVFQQELENQKTLEEHRIKLWDTPECQEGALFDLLDIEKKGYLTLEDMHNFLKPYTGGSQAMPQSERAFRRMCEDRDNQVSYETFNRAIRPIYGYRPDKDYAPKQKNLTQPKKYQKPAEPKPLRSNRSKSNNVQKAKRKLQVEVSKIANIEERDGCMSPTAQEKKRMEDPYGNYQTTAGRTDSPLRTRALVNDYTLHNDHPLNQPWGWNPWMAGWGGAKVINGQSKDG